MNEFEKLLTIHNYFNYSIVTITEPFNIIYNHKFVPKQKRLLTERVPSFLCVSRNCPLPVTLPQRQNIFQKGFLQNSDFS